MLRVACLFGILPAFAHAQLVSPTPIHNVGPVNGGVIVSHVFEIQNSGDRPLQLLEVRTGCGCLKALPDRQAFAAGEKGNLRIEVHTATQAVGANVWGAEVRYRSADRDGVLNLRLTGNVQPDLQLRPAALVIHTAATIKHPFTLTERRAKPVKLSSVTTTSPHVRLEISEPVRQGETWFRTLHLVVMPSCPEGRHECSMSIMTDDPNAPELRAPFTVVKKTPEVVQVSPPVLDWLGSGNEALPARLAILHGSEEKPVVIEEVSFSHPGFKATWVSGPRGTIRVIVDRDRIPDEGVEATAAVRLSSPSEKTVRIPLTVRLR